MATTAPSDLYPAVRAFLEVCELAKTAKSFDKETTTEVNGATKSKKAKVLASLEITAACELFLQAHEVADAIRACDLYPAVRSFLEECGLAKTVARFDVEAVAEENGVKQSKKMRKTLPSLEITAACELWLEANEAAGAVNGEETKKDKKKRKAEAAAAAEAAGEEEPAKKKKKEAAAEEAIELPVKDKKGKKAPKEHKTGEFFQREDWSKWTTAIKDQRMKDNTHEAKKAFGGGDGDTWADKASEDLLKTKGKGFRKEMAKKKRASWRGGGSLDQGVNSIPFSDSDDE